MVKLTSPYNFVPLNKRVYIPSWYNKVSQDIPFEDGEDGWIEVTWKNVSPLIIKEEADKGDSDNKESLPVHVEEADGKKLFFIPGTSMKGMLRSTLEILSFGKMEQYDNRFFGHREFDTHLTDGRDYQSEMQKVEWGWLRKDDNDDFFLSPCSSDVKQILIGELEKKYPGFDKNGSQWERNKYIAKKNSGIMFPGMIKGYRLYCTGKMHNKKHEYLIPVPAGKEEKLSEETRDEFLSVHGLTPDFDKFIALLDDGEMIPVSYIRKNEKVVAVGLSRMLRLPYEQDVRTLVEKEQEPVEGKDLCETIFGFTGGDGSLRGRVQVSHAFCTDEPDDRELLNDVSGVLGEPKPSFYPLYLKQPGPEYKTFNDADSVIAGRKLYRVHTGESVRHLPEGNGNKNTTSSFRPLKAGLTFVMRINLHNMRPVEIGAILSALTLHDTKGAWHNIGSAKSFGYGKLECKSVKLERLNHNKKYYMRVFEEEMEYFTRVVLSQKWRETEQVNMLVKILSEHTYEEVSMIKELKDYKEVSKNDSFQKLEEGNKKITYLLSADSERTLNDKVFHKKYEEKYETAKALLDEGKLDEAKKIYGDIILSRLQSGLGTDDEEAIIKKIQEDINKGKEKEEEEKRMVREAERKKRLDNGLKAILEDTYPDGRYKRDTVKKALDVTDRWLRQAKRKELTEQEKSDLLSTLKRLKSNPHQADKRMWGNPKDKTWERIERMIGKELTEELQN